jgi:hypothetical protein
MKEVRFCQRAAITTEKEFPGEELRRIVSELGGSPEEFTTRLAMAEWITELEKPTIELGVAPAQQMVWREEVEPWETCWFGGSFWDGILDIVPTWEKNVASEEC